MWVDKSEWVRGVSMVPCLLVPGGQAVLGGQKGEAGCLVSPLCGTFSQGACLVPTKGSDTGSLAFLEGCETERAIHYRRD